MTPTNLILKDVRKTPKCQSTTWTSNNTVGNTLSAITRKELDYQKKLAQLKGTVSSEEYNSYAQNFLYWTHMSCAFWLP